MAIDYLGSLDRPKLASIGEDGVTEEPNYGLGECAPERQSDPAVVSKCTHRRPIAPDLKRKPDGWEWACNRHINHALHPSGRLAGEDRETGVPRTIRFSKVTMGQREYAASDEIKSMIHAGERVRCSRRWRTSKVKGRHTRMEPENDF